jgi:hypothetical protein
MNKLLTILLCSLSFGLTAQTKKITLQIDTLDDYDRFQTLMNFKPWIGKEEVTIDTAKTIELHSFPNFIGTYLLENDSSEINIPVDLNGSYISLTGIYSLFSDTLRVNSLRVFKTKMLDTTFTIIEYYRKINGELEEKPYKLKKQLDVSTEKNPPKKIDLIVNGNKYILDLNRWKSPRIELFSGHGYRPRKYIDKNGDYKKKLTRLHVYSEKRSYYWTGQIRIKNGT